MNQIKIYFSIVAIFVFLTNCKAQAIPEKVSHAEPLFFDLVRDLGARKGEKEINVGANFTKSKRHNEYAFLVEYEFAPIHRLGLEVEADFSFFQSTKQGSKSPGHKLECLRLSSQYSFFVSSKLKTTLAVGYTQIVEFVDFNNYGKTNLIDGTVYNPFFVAAKRWGYNFHSLLYVSPLLEHDFASGQLHLVEQINTSVHYVIPQTEHFVGIELNKEVRQGKFEMTARPQVKVKVNHNLALGIAAGIPLNKPNERWSSFMRVIYEL